MKQKARTIHNAGKSPIEREKEGFEKWLMEPHGIRRGRLSRDALIYFNLEDSSKAPFSLRARVEVLRALFSPCQAQKSYAALKGLAEIARDGKSGLAIRVFREVSVKWLTDQTLRELHPIAWINGVNLINEITLLPGVHGRFVVENIYELTREMKKPPEGA